MEAINEIYGGGPASIIFNHNIFYKKHINYDI